MKKDQRKLILDFVKPLAVGIDGVTNFGAVPRMLSACEGIAAGRADVDRDQLFLLAAFSGQQKWARQFGQGSRLELFLASAGIAPEEIRRLRRSLARFEQDPQSAEEDIVHDARRLEQIGAYGIARIVSRGDRERMDFDEIAAEIDKETRDDFRTPAGRALAAPRLLLMRDFARHLREEVAAFAPGIPEGFSTGS